MPLIVGPAMGDDKVSSQAFQIVEENGFPAQELENQEVI